MRDLKEHEEYILQLLASENTSYDWNSLLKYHKTKIEFLQSERHMHLLVTLFFGLFLLASLFASLAFPRIELLLLSTLFLALLVPYIFYYYKLENTVQRWYILYSTITGRIK